MSENIENRLANLSPAKRALLMARMTRNDGNIERRQSIPRREDDAKSELSFAQERIWLHQQIQPSSIAYNRPTNIRLRGPLDVATFRLAMAQVLERHESLRSTVEYGEGKPRLVVREMKSLEIPLIDLREEGRPGERAQILTNEEVRRPFDLGHGPLLRARLLRLGNEEHLLLLTIHHFTFDAWSETVLLEELSSNYGALMKGEAPPLKPLPIQCSDFAAWDRSADRVAGLESGRAYWRTELADPPLLRLKTDYPRPLKPSEESGSVEFEFPGDLLVGLREVAGREESTLFSVLLSAFFALLHRYTGDEDIVVGCPVAGRTREELEPLIGVFINMMPLRARTAGGDRFCRLLGAVQKSVLQGLEYQEVPLQFTVQDVLSDRGSSGSPLYQAIFVHERLPLEPREADSVLFESEEAPAPGTMVDLTMEVSETEARVVGRLKYRQELWDHSTIERMVGQFTALITQVVANPDREINSYSLVTSGARRLLPNPGEVLDTSPEPSVVEQVDAWAKRAPDSVAIQGDTACWSYRELATAVGEFSGALTEAGVGEGTALALVGDRSFGFMVGLLGILKSGAVAVTLDPSLPVARIETLLEEAEVRSIVIVGEVSTEVMECLDDVRHFRIVAATGGIEPGSNSKAKGEVGASSGRLPLGAATIFFTSGTTGIPKGVLGSHQALSHFVKWQRTQFEVGPGDRIAQVTGITFDVMLREVFLPLTSGATLCLPEEGFDEGSEFWRWLEDRKITILHSVPSRLELWLEELPDGLVLGSMRWLFMAGEPLTDILVGKWRESCSGEVINLYGSTETGPAKLWYRVPSDDELRPGVQPLGIPLPQTQAFIMSGGNGQCGVGELGEIVLRSPFLAMGYLRAEANEGGFINNLFGAGEDEIFYRTGDLGRYLRDGQIEIAGRRDDQVKIRGVRVEPAEVSAVLGAETGVAQCFVGTINDEGDEVQLVAWVVPEKGSGITGGVLRQTLSDRLPLDFIPRHVVIVEHLPLTANGKVDRTALPRPEVENQSDYVSPRTPLEKELAAIWCDVLRVDRVGIHDDFFELGGHSLVAIRGNVRIASELQVELSVRSLFEAPTIAGLANRIEQLRSGESRVSPTPLMKVARDPGCRLPLSFSQQRLWFLEQLEGELTAYNMSFGWRIKGDLDLKALRGALETLVNRHEVLRTTFAMHDGEPVQVVGEAVNFDLPVVDLAPLEPKAQEIEISRFWRAEAGRAYDLSEDLMLRAFLLRLSEKDYVFLLMMHHIAGDGWSLEVLRRELGTLYRANCQGKEAGLLPLAIQYADFANWQRQGLAEGGRLDELMAYWREQLHGLEALELPTDRTRPLVPSYRGARQEFELPGELVGQLKELGRSEGATLQMTLLAAFQVLLSRYSRQDDIAVGTPIAGRNHSELEGQIGFFVNSLVMRTDLSGEPTFRELLGRVREMSLGAYDHEDLPFEKLVEGLQPERDPGRSPLFQVFFQLLDLSDGDLQLENLEVIRLPSTGERVRFDLEMNLRQRPEMLSGVIVYSTDLFDALTIERMVGHFLTLLEGVAKDPGKRLGELPMLSEWERHQLLVEWNDTAADYPERCVHERFEDQVTRSPESVAVVFEKEQLTYQSLNERANRVAHALIAHGVGPEVLVGICVERSFEMIIGLLGILKTGAAYVPLDPDSPNARLTFMLEDCGNPLVLTTEGLSKLFEGYLGERFFLDDDSALAGQAIENPGSSIDSKHLAYVIYTSGSTGRPKGAMISHRALMNHMCWMQEAFPITPSDRLLQKTPFTFDASVWEFYAPLLEGGRLILALPDGHRNPEYLIETIIDQSISVLQVVPTLLRALINHKKFSEIRTLKRVFSGGELLSADLQERFFSLSGASLYNLYGPTEVCIDSTAWSCQRNDPYREVAIGRPIANVQAYVLDQHGQLVPIGISGELYLGGAGLALGYLNRPELTAERFVEIEILDRTERVYRTGDLCRWRADGNIEFIGRLDDQVKLRGYRIELGEIEAVLNDHPDVVECVTMRREDHVGDECLVAYCVIKGDEAANSAALREHVGERLPSYMVPSAFVVLDKLPLTSSGKVSRRDLPEPDGSRKDLGTDYVAPGSFIEESLVLIWNEVLRRENVGIHDNFFEIGGHSLLAVRVNARIASELQIDLQVSSLFEAPTIAGLAEKIEHLRRSGAGMSSLPLIPVARDPGCGLPLSFSQQRLWFLEQLEGELTAYNMSFAWRIKGPLDPEALRGALEALVNRHEVLRTTFAMRGDEPVQIVGEVLRFNLPEVDLTPLGPEAEELEISRFWRQEAGRAFDLGNDLMLRAFLIRLSNNECVLLLVMHHIASDGWSLEVLRRELGTLYGALCLGENPGLSPMAVQYADFAIWQREGLTIGGRLEELLTYWRRQLSGLEALELPTDRSRPLVPSYRGARHEFELSGELVNRVEALGKSEGATLQMTLLAAFQVLLSRYSGQDDIAIGTPIAGRNHADLEGQIGFFVNTLVLRTDLSGGPTFRELLGRVREMSLGAYDHQDLPFEKLVEELQPERDLSRSPLFQVLFQLISFSNDNFQLEDLEVTRLPSKSERVRFDLEMNLRQQAEMLSGEIVYSKDLFDATMIERMVGHFLILLEGIVADPGKCIGKISMMAEGERHQLLVERNDTAVEYPAKCVHELFEEQAELTPDATAISCDGEELSYRELNERANQLAHHLRELGVGPDVLVAIHIDHSPNQVVAVLGILKAGGAYSPLSSSYPKERLRLMLEDAGVKVIIFSRALEAELPEHRARRICLEADWPDISTRSRGNPMAGARFEHLVYVLYTSGSTGRPKGVAFLHHGGANLIHWQISNSRLKRGNRSLLFSPLIFDVSFTDIFVTLCSGGALVMTPPEVRLDPARLSELLRVEAVERVTLPFVALQSLASHNVSRGESLEFPDLREVISTAEQLQITPAVREWLRGNPNAALQNQYGPTETHVVTALDLEGTAEEWPLVPSIGKPIANTRIYILDQNMEPVPTGIFGTLYIAGDNLARGYLNRPELTDEKFVPDPFDEAPDSRLYSTGDTCRWRTSGDIEFLGRNDDQVKIRGFRIEIGEVESVFNDHPLVAQCVVVLREGHPGGEHLAAYCVLKAEGATDIASLKEHASERLPNYMVPSVFVMLDTLPLTPSGKVDRRRLPEPERSNQELGVGSVGPRTPLEKELAKIWCDLLGLNQVGVHHDFFEIGGHSLLAVRVNARIASELQIDLQVSSLFEAPTIAGLAEKIEHLRRSGAGMSSLPLIRFAREPGGGLPLSFSQQRLWFLEQLEGELTAYNMSFAWRIKGALDVEALRRAFEMLVNRHEVLRTTFAMRDDEPVQIVGEELKFDLPVVDLALLEPVAQELEISRFGREEAGRAFDLENDVMLRAFLLCLSENEYVLRFTMHHIASDGWSLEVLRRELGTLYGALCLGADPGLAPMAVQYADFAVWQRQGLESGGRLEELLTYWRGQLSGLEALELPTDYSRPLVSSYRGETIGFELPGELVDQLKELGRQEGATLQMTLLAAFQVLLSRYSRQDDIAVGTPIAGRNHRDLEEQIGFFVNSLVLRTDLSGEPTFRELLGRVREMSLGAYDHEDLPFEKLVEELQPERDLSRSPLFQVLFQLINFSDDDLQFEGVEVSRLPSTGERVGFDLEMHLRQRPEMLSGVIVYSTDLFEAPRIERMVGHFLTLLKGFVAEPGRCVVEQPMLTAGERQQILVEWNDMAGDDPDRCVQELFEERVEMFPGAIALVCEEEQLTYLELNERANQLAHHLRDLGVKPEMLVGLCVERSLNTIIGFLGILKAGGVYVPFDSSSPRDRLEFMLQDSGVAAVITSQKLLGCLPGFEGSVVCLDRESDRIEQQPVGNPVNEIGLSQMAYVIYTSGSTGVPKGVVVEHGALAGHVGAMSQSFELNSDDRVLQFSSLSFDASIEQIMVALTSGARLIMRGESVWAVDEFLGRASEYGLTVCDLPTAYWQQLLASLNNESVDQLGTVRLVIVGGEQMSAMDVQKWRTHPFEQIRLLNAYGPTEATITASCYEVPYRQSSEQSVPIGRAGSKRLMFVLDQLGGLAPVGIPGELYIGGAGLARGYLNRPELTEERFVVNPFVDDPDSRIYRTGDLCRWRADGNLEFLGRVDAQVKLRGFRIELGEVESIINAHSDVSQSVVLLREDRPGDKRLVAYLVSTPGVKMKTRRVREHVQRKLPDYMVPSVFVELDTLPLTVSRKVDRRALPVPDGVRPELDSGFVAPRTMVEEKLSVVWRELLRVDRVGVHDNFFELGGHSLVAIRVNARIASELQVDLSVRSFFETPTIAGLADKIEQLQRGEARMNSLPLVRVARDSGRGLPLSFSQQRLWFLEQLEGELTAYNMSFAWRIEGSLDVAALRGAFETLVNRYEVLRTNFAMHDGGPVQIVGGEVGFDLPVVDLTSLDSEAQELEVSRFGRLEAERPFDLGKDLMLRAFLIRLSGNKCVLQFVIHHIASDGWSLEVLMRELGQLYGAHCLGEEPGLSTLSVQYSDFAVWQRQVLAGGGRLEELLSYWRGQLNGLEALELPMDRSRPLVPSYRGAKHQFDLPGELVDRLKALGLSEGATLQMTLLAAFQILLSRYSRQDDIAVGTPIAGRNHAELEEQIGFFVNTLVLRTDLSGEPTFRELLGRVREMSLGAYDYQDLPFEKLVEELQPERDLGRSPLFQVLFQLLNFSDDDLQLEGLAVSKSPLGLERVRFDLEMHLYQRAEILSGVIVYSTDLFDAPRIERMVGHFLILLEGVAGDSEKRLGKLPMLTGEERHQLLVEWNDTAEEYPAMCVHELFEEQVARTPDAFAVAFEGEQLSYRELNERANQLACHLLRQGVGPESLVGLCLDRSLGLAVGILGILKSGAAYVPLDPEFPRQRLEFILRDAEVEHVVTQNSYMALIAAEGLNLICVDAKAAKMEENGRKNPVCEANAGSLAYLLFTSGSTGQPKGVAMPHSALSNLIEWHRGHPRLGRPSRTLQFASVTFDVSFQEMLSTWACGGTLVLVDPETRRDPNALLRFISDQQVDRIFVPYVALQQLAIEFTGANGSLPLRDIVSAGEVLHLTSEIHRLLGSTDDCCLHNHYGPTESHVVTSLMYDHRLGEWSGECPIGKPLANTQIYVLDEEMNPVPIGVTGELHIGGAALARGYLNRPELTAERFVADPFDDDPDSRLYRTGDLCLWRDDGNLEFVGRVDDQVKLRGFRIELGEIEAVLNDHPGVSQSVVVLREDHPGGKRLVAYCVPSAGVKLDQGELKNHLKRELPDYMVPSLIIEMEEFPLTTSGKVARRALPAPDGLRPELDSNCIAPRTMVEEKMAEVWQELLGIDMVGIHDDFFELGGHSLLVARLVALVNERLASHLMIGAVYRSPTIAGMAELLEQAGGKDAIEAEANVGQFLTVLQKGSGGGCVVFVGGLLKERLKELPTSLVILHLALDGMGRNSFMGLDVQTSAKTYADELEAFQLAGPLVIVGHSYGGLLAYALAHQLRERSIKNFELILLEPTWRRRDSDSRQTLLQKVQLAMSKGPGSLMSSLMKSIAFRVRHRLTVAKIEAKMSEERSETGRKLEAGESLTGPELFKYFEKDFMRNARAYQSPGRLGGRVHLVYGDNWEEFLRLRGGDYLEEPPIILNLGDVDHMELMNSESAAMRWVELIRALVSSDHGSGKQVFDSLADDEGISGNEEVGGTSE